MLIMSLSMTADLIGINTVTYIILACILLLFYVKNITKFIFCTMFNKFPH